MGWLHILLVSDGSVRLVLIESDAGHRSRDAMCMHPAEADRELGNERARSFHQILMECIFIPAALEAAKSPQCVLLH
jgi:hypothetical protein